MLAGTTRLVQSLTYVYGVISRIYHLAGCQTSKGYVYELFMYGLRMNMVLIRKYHTCSIIRPPRINAPPPSSGAKLLRRIFILLPPPCRSYIFVHLLDHTLTPASIHTYVAQSFSSSIMSNKIRLEGKEVDSLSLST